MKAKIFLLFAVLLIVSGCSSVTLLGSWADPELKSAEGRSIAIFCLSPRLDVRDKIETTMSDMLQAKGVNAMRSMDFITPGKMDQQAIEAILKQNKITGVVIISLMDEQKETYYTPGTVYAPAYHGGYYGYYGSVYGSVYSPGYYTTTTSYFIQCNAYRLSDGKLGYSSQTKTVDPTNVNKLAYDYSKVLINDLEARGIIPASK